MPIFINEYFSNFYCLKEVRVWFLVLAYSAKTCQGNWSVSEIFDLVSKPVIGRAKAPGNIFKRPVISKASTVRE